MHNLGNFPVSSHKKQSKRLNAGYTKQPDSSAFKNATSHTEDDLSILCVVSNCSREQCVPKLGPANFLVTNKLKCPL